MDESSIPIENAIMRLNGMSSNTMATSTPTKRNNPYIDDEPDDVKKRKIEQSASTSVARKKQYFPIASLKPMFSCPPIKGTLTEVSEWLVARSQAKFLVFRLRDESGDIKGIAFDPMGADFHKNFKLGATVTLKKSKVEKEGNKPDGSETYKLIVNRHSSIKIEDNSPAPPKPVRKMIRDILDNSNERDVIDVLGILEEVGEIERNLMREIRIVDESEANIIITLWDNSAKNFNAQLGSVIAAYRVAVRIFNSSKLLRTCHLTKLLVDPPIDETQRLKQWYSEWTAAAEARENENSMLMENMVQGTTNSIIDNRKTEIVDSFAHSSTLMPLENHISVEEVLKSPAGAIINIVGSVLNQEPPVQQQTRSGKSRWMKTVMLTDRKNSVIELAIWGDEVKDHDIPPNSAVAAKNVTVRDFGNNKTLSCLWSNLQIDTKAPQTAGLRINIPNNSTTTNETENSVIAGSSRSPGNSLNLGDITPIKEIMEMANAGSKHNIVALVTKCGPPEEQQTKSGRISWMRTLMLMDDKDSEIELAVWGDAVKVNEIPLHSVIRAKNVTVRDFNDGKTLTCLWMHLQIEPNIPQVARLRNLIPTNSTTNETENSVIAGPSKSPNNSLHCQNVTSIKEIKDMAIAGSKHNIVALVTKCGPPEEQLTRSKKTSWMRAVILMDDTDSEIEMAVWGESVKSHDIPLHSVIMARNVTVRDFNDDKTLTCLWMHLQIEPNVPQAARLKKLIPNNSTTNEIENSAIAGSSRSPDNFLHCQNITSIKEIKDMAMAGSKHNIVALVTQSVPPEEQQTRAGKRMWMRILMLMDDEDSEIEMAVWGGSVKDNDIPLHSVIMARNVTVREFNDEKTFSCLWMHLQIEPNVPQAASLRKLIPKNSATNETENAVIAGSSKSRDNFLDCKTFTSIKEIKEMPTSGSKYDIVALVTECGPPEEQQTRSGKRAWMRVVMLMDDVDSEMEMTIWGNEVKRNEIPFHSVITVRDVTVRDFNDYKTLSCLWSHLQINPAIPQAARLKKLIANSSESETEIIFTPIREIKSEERTQSICNIIGIVLELESPKIEKTEVGNDSSKRIIIVSDEPYSKIALTICGQEVMEHEIPLHSVIIAQNVEIQQSNDDKTLKCLWIDFKINPDITEADEIAKIFANHRYEAKKHIDSSEFDSFERIIDETGRISKWNLIGLVKKTEPSMRLDSSPDEDFWFTKVKLKDADKNQIELVVWSDESLDSAIPLDSIFSVKGAEARMVNDRVALGAFWHFIEINPDIPEAQRLKQVRKKDWHSRRPNFREYLDVEFGDYTPIDMIRRWNKPGDCINTIGLVVEVNPSKELTNKTGSTYFTRKCVLRGKNGTEIQLTIFSNLSNPFEIPLNSVISVKDATLKHTEDEKKLLLSCRFINVDFDINIPETEGFKEAALNTFARFENPEDQDPNNFTAMKEIEETRPLGSILNVLGLVVDVIKRNTKKVKADTHTVRVTLMDTDKELITLIIKKTPVADNRISVHSVIAARDATLRQCGDDKVLWCLRSNVEINPRIPEAEERKFNELKKIPFVRDFMPFKTILHERSLIDCKVDIIGEVIEILPPYEIPDFSDQLRFVRPFILRNEIDIKLNIWNSNERNPSLNDDNAIKPNTIISAKGALIERERTEILLSVNWSNVKINPKISENDRGAKSLSIVPIKRILEEAKVGEKLGILAVVRKPPMKIFGGGNITDSSEDSDEESRTKRKREPGMESAKLIDSSGGIINMTMPFSIAKALRKNSEKTVAIRARNVQVCEYDGDLELACTIKSSRVEINPETMEAKELLKWYDLFCKKEKDEKEKEEQRELPIVPINLLLENWVDKTRASVMGILIASKICKIEESDLQFETRRIQIIDESEKVINLLLWNFAAKDFDVPLYSIIMVTNFHVYAEGEVKCGIFGPETEYKVITASGKYLKATQRLESWFDHYIAQSQNLANSSDESNNAEEDSIALLNITKVARNRIISPNDITKPNVLANDMEMVKSPTVLANDTKIVKSPIVLSSDIEMVESPTVLSNVIEMIESPTVSTNDNEMVGSQIVFSNDTEMTKSPTLLSNDIKIAKIPKVSINDIKMVESRTILPNDVEMVESPTVLTDDIEMVESSQKIEENRRIFFGNESFSSKMNEAIFDSSNVDDSESPDMFEDC